MGILRLLLALAVVAEHSRGFFGNYLVGGGVAVQSFYLISGFYMALVLNGKYENRSWRTFMSQRLLRLYPLYVVILLLTLGWGLLPWLWKGMAPNGPLYAWYVSGGQLSPGSVLYLVTSQITLIGQDLALFLKFQGVPLSLSLTTDGINQPVPVWTLMLVPQAWSISVELLFYCVAPFLVRMKVRNQILFVAASLFARAIIYYGLNLRADPWTHRLILLELGTFLVGSLAFQFYARHREKLERMPQLGTIAVVLISVVSVSYASIGLGGLKRLLYYALIVSALPVLFARFKGSTIDLKLGELSYPIYMVHMLVIAVVGPVLAVRAPVYSHGAVIAVFSVAAAVALYIGAVAPLDSFRHRLLNQKKRKQLATEQAVTIRG